MVGHDAQGLIGVLSHADSDFFFANRKAAGFNSFWIDVLCYRCTGNGNTTDGIAPFTTPGDISTPNEVYFARVDDRIQLAAQYGLNVVLDPAETIGSLQLLRDNGPVKDRAYGQYLGNRYKNFNNIIWMSGNDFQTWSNPSDDAVVQAVALGIRDIDTRHIHTIELNYSTSDSLDDSAWAPIVSLNAAYSYYPTYTQVLTAYNRSNFVPVFMVEANYEFGHNSADYGTPDVLRKQEYWTMLSGGNAGQQYGNHHMSGSASFASGWQSWLGTPGAVQMGYMRSFFEPRPWYDLVPDQTHAVVTAVTGGFGPCNGYGTILANNCTTTARTSDGNLVIAYVPINAALTVNMSQLSGQASSRWFDPSSNTYRSIAGSPFANSGSLTFNHPGNNSDGFSDWVLVLESLATPTPTATPTVTVTPMPSASPTPAPSPTATPTPTVTPTASPTPTPINISGAVTSCWNAVPGPVPNVTLTLTGDSTASALSDGSGNYVLSSLAAGGSYSVTATKPALTPGSAGISTVDTIAVQRHFFGLGPPLSGCRLTAADVNGDGTVDTVDAIAIQRFFLGGSTGIGNVGMYQFSPANRNYPEVVTDQAAQNYDMLVFGDVASPFAE